MADISNVKSVWINGALHFQNPNGETLLVIGGTTGIPFTQRYTKTITCTTATTMVNSTHGGCVMTCGVDATVITMPTLATVSCAGLTYTFVNTASDGGALLQIKGAGATDWFSMAGEIYATTELCCENAKSTQRKGDSVTITSNGSTCWIVSGVVGTWTLETTT